MMLKAGIRTHLATHYLCLALSCNNLIISPVWGFVGVWSRTEKSGQQVQFE